MNKTLRGADLSTRRFGGRPQPHAQERSVATLGRIGDHAPLRSLAIYEAIGASLAMESP